MTIELDITHDPARKSWVASANDGNTDFPLQNLPFCVFARAGEPRRPGVAIGDQLLDLDVLLKFKVLDEAQAAAIGACKGAHLGPIMALAGASATALRHRLSEILASDHAAAVHASELLIPQVDARYYLPAEIGGFTDFFTSLFHTERGGRASRPDNPVPLNFRYMPIAYNSRASSVRISGESIRRPLGQRRGPTGEVHFGPCENLDFELELGAFVGKANQLGEPVSIDEAGGRVFGYCLLNDWSARDIQRWESVPLGPFLAKTLSTSISPFVVTSDALRPFRAPAAKRPDGDPAPLDYLYSEFDQRHGGIDLKMEALIQTEAMRDGGFEPHRISSANFKDMYWTVAQMVAHHTINGCNLRIGDLIGSGTVSGPTDDSRACLAEIVASGDRVSLPNGEHRTWLEDGDTIAFRAKAERKGFVSIGFGECTGRIVPAIRK
ncbi:fumarylacetoacetase [Bradyrhizobium sp. BR 10289]|uniref:fumarylacetoacetase n=1 Tax=Bradyrhizobium sp. BR 10289 TaxID=2749993 RepID=UPI001C6496BD|nr:fumarylacetoacetase [Bradyrhizobium sp. BR 10289]MBW7970136.1 fumarylacetoacetase [Bradyrhizobium sp. BR 10289]